MYQNASSWHDLVLFQHESFSHGVVLLRCHVWRVSVLCLPLFTYYLANHRMVFYLLNSIFKLKSQTICNVYSIIIEVEVWNFQACKCHRYSGIHVVTSLTPRNILDVLDEINNILECCLMRHAMRLCYCFGYDATVRFIETRMFQTSGHNRTWCTVKFLMKYLSWIGTSPVFTGCTRKFI